MLKTVLLSATAIAMMFSLPAYSAECQAELADLNDKISKNDSDLRVAASGPRAADIRKLRDAARILERNGREEECRNVVAAMEEILENPDAEESASNRTMDRDTWFKSELDRVKTAQPVGQLKEPLRAKAVLGADIRNNSNADLGEVEDFVLNPADGKVQSVIMSHGGFLGMGDEQIAVPWQELRVAGKEDDRVFILNISEEAMKNAPRYKRGEWSTMYNEDWRQQNERFYKENRK